MKLGADEPLSLARISEDLSLWIDKAMQDWGIVNADSARLRAFAPYAAQHADTPKTWAAEYGLGELLLESANDALLQRLSCGPWLTSCWLKRGSPLYRNCCSTGRT
ncbi:hypothetical protein GO986_07685 [Deinococcus sp. HMF7620]|uniref:Uncharacterized protein n=1 Tax=Deinococcus arboris TaxID=2682977 RepID=A0A7C9M5T9_9DEIO|nr:hypothetical protein [Deinococcus arboris]MVN86645.1 hypothetical protein [Deinococcus arboris]